MMIDLRKTTKIQYEIYEAATRNRPQRQYLGMSQIGDPCTRRLWYVFRQITPKQIDGRMVLLFELGDLIEKVIVDNLKKAGYRVEGQQTEFVDFGGYFRGHCDGIIHGVTRRPHILECKSCNDKKFKMFQDFGLQQTSPQYYCQAQCYMGYAELERTLFVIYNKNTSEIYTERICFNKNDFESIRKRAEYIITTSTPPEREHEQDSFECKYCDYYTLCWDIEHLQTDKKCMSCKYWRIAQIQDGATITYDGLCVNPQGFPQVNNLWGEGCDSWQFIAKGGQK